MNDTLAETYGRLALINIFSSIWLGDWEQFEKGINRIPENLREELPFHSHYQREEADLWHQNHFYIPGDHFVSPYFSTYSSLLNNDHEKTNAELLCLIGHYEKMGFYFPLEKKMYPDHIGCLNLFVNGIFQEEIKGLIGEDQNLVKELESFRKEIVGQYLIPLAKGIKKAADNKIKSAFLKTFLEFYCEFVEKEMAE